MKSIINKIPPCVAVVTVIGSLAGQLSLAVLARPEKSPTPTKQPSPTTSGSTKAPRSSVASGTTPKKHSAGLTKNSKPKTKGRNSSKQSKKNRVRGQREIEPSRVLEIQQALRSAGFYHGEPTGKWDTSTIQAMSAYQTDNGFKVTGKPDALSLKKLGL